MHVCTVHGDGFIQDLPDTQPKYTCYSCLSSHTHLEIAEEKSGHAKNDNVNDDISYTTANVHDGIIGSGNANYPVAPKWSDLEERSEEK